VKKTYTYNHYYLYSEITEILQQYAKQFPEYCRLTSLAKTLEGRDIWKFELTDRSTGEFDEKPALCVTGNIHAGEVTGSVCVMHWLDYLLTNKEEPEVAGVLKNFTVYAIPRISPDGSETYLTTPTQLRSINKMHPFDELQPGVQPADLDGDGVIRHMRVKAKNGAWKISSKDARAMCKRRPDEMEGEFYNIYSEGDVLEFDGVNLQPAPAKFGNDYNRNFPCNWQPENKQAGSGSYALSNLETRVMADFIDKQKNLCAILNFHTWGGMYLYPPGYKSGKEAYKEDMDRYRTIGKMAEEETTYPALNMKDDYAGKAPISILGLFDDFCHFTMGVMDYACECWDFNTRIGCPNTWPRPEALTDDQQEDMAVARLKWLDENNDGKGFKNWTKYEHPVLGEVEIGGLDVKTVVQNPPEKFLDQEAEKHTKFLMRFMKTLPRLALDQVKVMPLGNDHYKIEAVVENLGYLPTYILQEALDIKKAAPVCVELGGENVEFVSGKAKEEIGHLQGFSGVRINYSHTGPVTVAHPPCAKKVEWVIKAPQGNPLTITASAPRAGKVTETILIG